MEKEGVNKMSSLDERLRFCCDFCSARCPDITSCDHRYNSSKCKDLYNAMVENGIIQDDNKPSDQKIRIVKYRPKHFDVTGVRPRFKIKSINGLPFLKDTVQNVTLPEHQSLRQLEKILKAQDECERVTKCIGEQIAECTHEAIKYAAKLKRETGITNDALIGCYMCNYNDQKMCDRFSGKGCKDQELCKCLDDANDRIANNGK